MQPARLISATCPFSLLCPRAPDFRPIYSDDSRSLLVPALPRPSVIIISLQTNFSGDQLGLSRSLVASRPVSPLPFEQFRRCNCCCSLMAIIIIYTRGALKLDRANSGALLDGKASRREEGEEEEEEGRRASWKLPACSCKFQKTSRNEHWHESELWLLCVAESALATLSLAARPSGSIVFAGGTLWPVHRHAKRARLEIWLALCLRFTSHVGSHGGPKVRTSPARAFCDRVQSRASLVAYKFELSPARKRLAF